MVELVSRIAAMGLLFIAGCHGADGQDGTMGALGEQGPAGPEGPQGPAGPQGSAGPQGEQGIQGEQGSQGSQGPAGPAGLATLYAESIPGYGFFIPGGTTFTRGPYTVTIPSGVTKVNVRFTARVIVDPPDTARVTLASVPGGQCEVGATGAALSCDFILDVTPNAQQSLEFQFYSSTQYGVNPATLIVQAL